MNLKAFVRQNGLFSTLEEIVNRFKLWDLDKGEVLDIGTGSSFSDNPEYLSIVVLATHSDEVFPKFRSNRQYRRILEHVTKQLGIAYLGEMRDRIDVKVALSRLTKCDKTGGPLRYYFRGLGFFSPTTIRYLFFHSELIRIFGDLSGMRVVEVGGGFGGQAAVSTTLTENLEWVIFDLPEVSLLQERYLIQANPHARVTYKSGLDISDFTGDVLLSNYALSEISRELQIEYMNKVVLNCNKGYMAWNTLSETLNGGLSLSEVLEMIPGSRAVPERPHSSPGNKFIVWG